MATIVGLLVVLGGGYFVYQTYMARTNLEQAPPQEQIDVIGIKSDLLAIGQAERQYVVMHETYGTIEQLGRESLLNFGAERRGYLLSVAVDGSRGFTVTAMPSDANKVGWPTFAMNEMMQITER